jgi:hypothetical protein
MKEPPSDGRMRRGLLLTISLRTHERAHIGGMENCSSMMRGQSKWNREAVQNETDRRHCHPSPRSYRFPPLRHVTRIGSLFALQYAQQTAHCHDVTDPPVPTLGPRRTMAKPARKTRVIYSCSCLSKTVHMQTAGTAAPERVPKRPTWHGILLVPTSHL